MIPPVIHFIWVSLGETLPDLYKLCILSAVISTKCKVVLHTDDPTIALPQVETRLRHFPQKINNVAFDPNEDVHHKQGSRVSHLKDIVRLEILYSEGGIYSDLDMIWLRHPWFHLQKKVVMGYQTKGYKTLCNAVIFSEPKHPAIKDYLDWTISIYPPKKYWLPANPYKLWEKKSYRNELTYIERYEFFDRRFRDESEYSLEKIQRSTGIHLWQAGRIKVEGPLIEELKKAIKEELNYLL